MLYLIYTLLLALLGLLVLPFLLYRYWTTPKYRGTIHQRLGFLDPLLLQQALKKPVVWLHAVSVGEAMAARDLSAQLAQRYPDHLLVVSTVTKTGRQVVLEKMPHVHHHLYLPLDFPFCINRVIKVLKPKLCIVMETELWPNFFRALHQNHCPIVVVNGRLSPQSFKSYHKARWAMRPFLAPVTHMAMQSELDAQRMQAIGGESQRVSTTGNLKYDQALRTPSEEEMAQREACLGEINTAAPIIMAASTHPGEERLVLDAFINLRQQYPDLRLILAPRHPERASEVRKLIESSQLSYQALTQNQAPWQQSVLLVDTIGWLTRLYPLCQGVFMGGSLIPRGGQNMLEPSACGIPTLYGPHTFNFRHIAQQLEEAKAAIRVADQPTLEQGWHRLLSNPDHQHHMGQAAKSVVESNTGALQRTLAQIEQIYPGTTTGTRS
ncbi:3-deoxy-D-manno-octulosonic acid transferase [Magnetococcus sp. PR-3]|uniref:3-deoxy-D-manno-octulosonic acid transferase n=1 Tax=Magnetococcus sp. PR-3 TaxID=3120355 RepID=UPI002FCE5A4D